MNFREYFGEIYGTASLESLMSGNKEREIEFTMYVQLDDLDELKKKAIRTERHEQWNMPLNKKDELDAKMRIRLIDNTRPTMCTKIKRTGQVGAEEVEMDISMDMFNSLREMAVDGYIKTRYTIPSNIRELVWEVDVFLLNGGAPSPWVKVDLEVKSLNDPIPVFPLSHTRVIYADEELSFSDRQKVNSLWGTEWQKMDKIKM
jgi:CYTH domain-containing protein